MSFAPPLVPRVSTALRSSRAAPSRSCARSSHVRRCTAIASALLPAMFLLRRDSRVRSGAAIGALALGTAIVMIGVASQGWLDRYVPSARQNERMFQRMRANDLAGRVQDPGTTLRELRDATSTPEQRKARYEQFLVSRAQQIARVTQPTPWDGRLPDLLGLPHLGFSWWTLPAIMSATALALLIASSRRHRGTGTPAPTP